VREKPLPYRDIETLMFTHHHLDHNEEFIPLFIKTYFLRIGNIKIIGPPRTREYCELNAKFYDQDIDYRMRLYGINVGKKNLLRTSLN